MDEDDDYDSAADSDYKLGDEIDEINESSSSKKKASSGLFDEAISATRKRKANEAYNALLQEDQRNLESTLNKAKLSTSGSSEKKPSMKQMKNEAVLASIFGKNAAKKLLKTSSFVHRNSNDNNDLNTKEMITAAVKKIQKKQKIVETRKFAGQEIKFVEN